MSGDLDHIIDDVAREMTAVPAGHGFMHRVQLRIETAQRTRRSLWMRSVLLAPLAAACILVVAVFVVRDNAPVERLHAPAPPAIVSSAPTVVTPNDEPVVAHVPSVVPARAASTARVSSSPLPAIEILPLEVERLDVRPMAQAQQLEIEIDPIAIAQIEIPPMP